MNGFPECFKIVFHQQTFQLKKSCQQCGRKMTVQCACYLQVGWDEQQDPKRQLWPAGISNLLSQYPWTKRNCLSFVEELGPVVCKKWPALNMNGCKRDVSTVCNCTVLCGQNIYKTPKSVHSHLSLYPSSGGKSKSFFISKIHQGIMKKGLCYCLND